MSDPLVTLLTDFGYKDSYVAQMKGVILAIAPGVRIVDATHEIPPQDFLAAGRFLTSLLPVYPAGTIHACVVDPGVGSDRSFLLVQTQQQTIIAPDNGLLTPVIDCTTEIEIREMSETWYRRSNSSSTFHGRDLVAPAAGHLAAGVPHERFGPLLDRPPVRVELPVPTKTSGKVQGCVTDIDHFGNLLTNLTPADWQGVPPGQLEVVIGERIIFPLREYYSQVSEGELLALVSSFGTLEIACRNGNAAKLLGAVRGMIVDLKFST